MFSRTFNHIKKEDLNIILGVFSDVETIRKKDDGYSITLTNNGGHCSLELSIENNEINNIKLITANSI